MWERDREKDVASGGEALSKEVPKSRKWLPEEEERLIALWKEDVDIKIIGKQLSRSQASLMTHASRLELPRRRPCGRRVGSSSARRGSEKTIPEALPVVSLSSFVPTLDFDEKDIFMYHDINPSKLRSDKKKDAFKVWHKEAAMLFHRVRVQIAGFEDYAEVVRAWRDRPYAEGESRFQYLADRKLWERFEFGEAALRSGLKPENLEVGLFGKVPYGMLVQGLCEIVKLASFKLHNEASSLALRAKALPPYPKGLEEIKLVRRVSEEEAFLTVRRKRLSEEKLGLPSLLARGKAAKPERPPVSSSGVFVW